MKSATVQAIATPRPDEVARMTGAEIRDSFLVSGLFEPGAVRLVLTIAHLNSVTCFCERCRRGCDLP